MKLNAEDIKKILFYLVENNYLNFDFGNDSEFDGIKEDRIVISSDAEVDLEKILN